MWIKLLLPLFIIAFCASSRAAEPVETPTFLIQSNESLPEAQSESLVLNYNSKLYDAALLDGFSKAELIQMIRTNTIPKFEKGEKRTEFSVPFGPSVDWSNENINSEVPDVGEKKKTLLDEFKKYRVEFSREAIQEIKDNLENLSEAELKTFLSKKHGFLLSVGQRFEKTFKSLRIRVPYKFIQNLMNSLNNVFYQKSEQFVKSNTYGIPVFVTAGIGATMGRLIYDFLISKTPLGKVIKPSFGFYLSSSFGIGISRIQVDKKSAWVLDMFFDFEHLKRAFLPIFEGGAAGGLGFYMETRTLPEKGKWYYFSQKAYSTANYSPLVGTTRSGKTGLSNQHSWGVVFPFPSTFYETNINRQYMHIVLKGASEKEKNPKSFIGEFISGLSQFLKPSKSLKNACVKFYSL